MIVSTVVTDIETGEPICIITVSTSGIKLLSLEGQLIYSATWGIHAMHLLYMKGTGDLPT